MQPSWAFLLRQALKSLSGVPREAFQLFNMLFKIFVSVIGAGLLGWGIYSTGWIRIIVGAVFLLWGWWL